MNEYSDRCDYIFVKEFDRSETRVQDYILNNALLNHDTDTKFVFFINDDIDDSYLSAANVRRFRWYSL